MNRKLSWPNNCDMLIFPTFQNKWLCNSLPTLLHHDVVMQVIIHLRNDIWSPCIPHTLYHLVHHMNQTKREYLIMFFWVYNVFNVHGHDQLYSPEPLLLTFESMIKACTFFIFMIILLSYQPLPITFTFCISHALL